MPAFCPNGAFHSEDGSYCTLLLRDKNGCIVGTTKVDNADFKKISRFSWSLDKEGYARNNRAGGRLHKVILGTSGRKAIVDHIYGDRLDNRRSKLAIVSQSVNNHHRPMKRNNKSGAVGVIFVPRIEKWMAYIGAGRKRHHIGYFHSFDDAVMARDQKARELFGPFAHTNSTYA